MNTDNLFYPLLSFIPALFNIGVFIYILFYLPRNKTTDIFTCFVAALAIWQIQDGLDRVVLNKESAIFVGKFFCIGWISSAPLAFHFACKYSSLKFINNRFFRIGLYIPFVVLHLLYVSNYQVQVEHDERWGWVTTPDSGPLDGILRTMVAVFMLATVVVLLRHAFKLRKNKVKKLQSALIAFGILIPLIGGVITQIAFPILFSLNELPLTSTLLTFFSIGSVLSLSKYRLFNISESVATESVLQNLKNIVLVVSPERKVLYMNPFSKKLFNWNEDEVQHFPNQNIFPSEESYNEFKKAVFDVSLSGKVIKNYTTALKMHDGKKIDLLISAESVSNNGLLQGILIVGYDITEHLKILQELKTSNDRYNLISQATNDMVWDWNLLTGEVYRNNEGWKKIFEETLNEVIGSEDDWIAKVHPDDKWKLLQMKKRIENSLTEHSFEVEIRVVKNNGAIVYIQDRGYVVRDVNGRPIRVIGATQDITSRKLSEKRLEEEQLRKHKEITDAVIIAQENERRLIGAELHDNVNQILTSATLYLSLARTEVDNRDQYFAQTETIIANAMREVRKLSHTLIPPSLSGETLVEAMVHLISITEKGGLFVVTKDFKDFQEGTLSQKLKLNIYRIVQEQLSNIIKHSGASTVHIRLAQEKDHILLSIQDDGIGFDMSKKWKGVGFTNIETRAYLHNGNVRIISSPQNGCKLQLIFPCHIRNRLLADS